MASGWQRRMAWGKRHPFSGSIVMLFRQFLLPLLQAIVLAITSALIAAPPPMRKTEQAAAPVAEPARSLAGSPKETTSGGLAAELLAEPPGLFINVEAERRVLTGKVRAEVEHGLSAARKLMAINPAQAEQDLKLTLEQLELVPIDAEIRDQLRREVSSAIRLSRQRRIEIEQQTAVAQERRAAAQEQERLSDNLATQQQRLKQIVDRFDSLMDEQRYQVADEQITPEIQRLAPNSTIESSLVFGGRFQRAVNDNEQTWRTRNNNFVRALGQVELSLIPFPDEPPIVYLPADQWEDLTLRRQKYKAVDLGKQGGAEQRIFLELNKTTNLEVVEMPLKDVVLYLSETHNIPIVLSTKKLEEASVSPDTPITKSFRGITLRSALRLLLRELELTYVVRDEVLQITTPEDAESQLITKVYPVGDLVVPITTGGGGNLFGLGGIGNGSLGGVGGGGFGGGGLGGGGLGGGGFGGGGLAGGGGVGGGFGGGGAGGIF
jgi:hypothetical protein